MNKSKVYFTNLRTNSNMTLLQKLDRLVKKAGIENIDFNGVEKVGIMAGASTPDEDIKDVVNKIKFKERN